MNTSVSNGVIILVITLVVSFVISLVVSFAISSVAPLVILFVISKIKSASSLLSQSVPRACIFKSIAV